MESYEKDTMIQNENGKLITSVLQFIITFVWEGRYSMFFLQTCVCKHGIKNIATTRITTCDQSNNIARKWELLGGFPRKIKINIRQTNSLTLYSRSHVIHRNNIFLFQKKREPREKQNITIALRVVAVVVQQELTQ